MLKKYILLTGIAIGFSLLANAQNKNSCGVTAGFTAPPVCFSNCVIFTGTSTGATLFTWNFGDSTTSNAASPTHCYKHPGSYQVTLIASNSTCSDTAKQTVEEYPIPVAAFSSTAFGCGSLCVNFIDMSTVSGGGTIAAWSWNFGDGTAASALQNPNHCYATPGTYNVELTVVSNAGCDTTIGYPVEISPWPVVSISVSPSPVKAGVPETFIDTNSKGIANYNWNFGDGSTGMGDTVTHTYAMGGTYYVLLSVTSDSGCVDTASLLVTVPAGIQSINSPSEAVSIFPNPSNGKFELKITNAESGIKNVEVYNVLGEKVSQYSSLNTQYYIDISSQPTGMYFVKVTSGQSYKVLKFIKE